MGVLITLLVILFLIGLILAVKISVRLTATEDFKLFLGVGFVKIPLFPVKEKEVRLKDYKIRSFRKNLKREEEKAERRRLKKLKKSEKAKLPVGEINVSEKKKNRDIMGTVSVVRDVAEKFISRLGKHLRIKLKRLVIIVATGSAADTAVLFGAVSGAVACLLELLRGSLKFKYTKDAEVSVSPDFTSDKLYFSIDVTFSFRVWQALDIGLRSLWTLMKSKLKKL